MPFGIQNFQATQPIAQATNFTSADTTVAKSILAAQGGPYAITDIIICSDDTAAINVDIFLRQASTNSLIGSVTVPASSGHAGVPPILFFYQINITSLLTLSLPGQYTLQAACEATMTAGKTMTITPFGGLF